MLRLHHLQSFVTLAEELHFGRAAERLHLTQPSLSEQIRALERELGVELVVRGRQVRLTDAGEAFRGEAARLLEEIDRARDRTQRVARGETGRLSVAAVASAMVGFLPWVVREFRAQRPEVGVEVRETNIREALDCVTLGAADLALVRTPLPELDDVESEPLRAEPWVALLPDDHPAAAQEAVGPGALAGGTLIFFPRAYSAEMYDELVAYSRPAQVREVLHITTAFGLIAAGMGFSPQPAGLTAFTHAGVRARPLAPPGLESDLVAVWRRDDPSAVRDTFLAVSRAVAARPLRPGSG